MEQYNKNYLTIEIVKKENKKMTKKQFKQLKFFLVSLSENKIETNSILQERGNKINGISARIDLKQFKRIPFLEFVINYLTLIQGLNNNYKIKIPTYNIKENYSHPIGGLRLNDLYSNT